MCSRNDFTLLEVFHLGISPTAFRGNSFYIEKEFSRLAGYVEPMILDD
jgi:hypothetical protein